MAMKKGNILLGLGLATVILGILTRRLTTKSQLSTQPETRPKPGRALITGASSGIGAAFARRLASQGYDLLLVARREERLKALANELQTQYHVTAEILAADLSNCADIERIEKRLAELESIEMLINNAGFGTVGMFAEMALEKQLEMIWIHVIASVRLSRAVLPGMIARGHGAIINLSSIGAFTPAMNNVTYNATKAYLTMFSEALQMELEGTGVRVQALCPGFTYTEFHDTAEYKGFEGRSRIPKALWMSAEDVVAGSLAALKRGEVIYIPGFKNRVIVAIGHSKLNWLLAKFLAHRFPQYRRQK